MKSNRNPLKKSERALKGTPEIKKDIASLQNLDIQSGEYRNRTNEGIHKSMFSQMYCSLKMNRENR